MERDPQYQSPAVSSASHIRSCRASETSKTCRRTPRTPKLRASHGSKAPGTQQQVLVMELLRDRGAGARRSVSRIRGAVRIIENFNRVIEGGVFEAFRL